MKKLTKTEIKHLAQDEIISQAHNAWSWIEKNPNELSEEQELEFQREITRQIERVERLFGYEILG